MSILRTYNVQNPDSAATNIQLSADGGIAVAGIVTATSGFSGNLTGNVNATGVSTFSGGIQVGSASSITIGDTFVRRGAVGLGQTTTTGRNAGVGTAVGTLIYNSTTDSLQLYTITNEWVSVKSSFTATGGTVTYAGGQAVHTFTTSSPFVVTSGATNVSVLIVAGGGGGGGSPGNGGGGGGAGGLVYVASTPLVPGTYPVTVGTGGAAGSRGTNGLNSVFGSLTTAVGGGGGGNNTGPEGAGNPGGSGGGRGRDQPGPAPAGTAGQGNNGGNAGGASCASAGGGGGAGAAGNAGSTPDCAGSRPSPASIGGDGLPYSISGTSTFYAGGGGGSYESPAASNAPGGAGGGGRGSAGGSGPAQPGTDNTGGGGGGGQSTAARSAGNGGPGVVIVSYPI